MEDLNSEISKDFLEKILNFQIERFEVNLGSELGDGYTCLLLSVAVWRASSPAGAEKTNSVIHLIVKCYPRSATKQEFLEATQIFSHELKTYSKVIPELYKFQKGVSKIVVPPFAELIYGSYVGATEARSRLDGPFSIRENCIVLPDLRSVENGCFRLRDRFLGLDLDHYSLVIQAQARLHAISWAYKQTEGLRSLIERFPFLDVSANQKQKLKSLSSFVATSVTNANAMFQGHASILAAIQSLEKRYLSVLGLYLGIELGQSEKGFNKDNVIKRPEPTDGAEEPWLVLLHGDAWSNNMMFRYDEKTGRPVQVLFIDLQKTREGDPLADIVYTLYCCTRQEFRSNHLTSSLLLYYDTFNQVCREIGVASLPGFTWPEFTRRFRRAKIFGAAFATMCLPIDLKPPEELVKDEMHDGDESRKKSSGDFFESLVASTSVNSVVKLRLREVLEDMIADDIL